MHDLALNTLKRFKNLLDEIAAENVGPQAASASRGAAVDNSDLGPSVGGDNGISRLGPSVGDDTRTSDLRLKQDLRCIGTTVFGLPLYHFQYRGQSERFEGVIAQDVLQVMPGAVSLSADGYYQVNYSALGTRMRRVS